jgi:hypothetical protein
MKQLVEGMMTVNKNERMGIDTVIMHPFITNFTSNYLALNKKIPFEALNNMKSLYIMY